MSELRPMDDEAVARSVMYLAGAFLLIVVFAVVGLLLNAELGEQAKLRAQAEQSVVVQTTSPLTSKGGFFCAMLGDRTGRLMLFFIDFDEGIKQALMTE